MKVLLDECVDPAAAGLFTRHPAEGVLSAGLSSLANSELLREAQGRFEAFVTVDKGIYYQQNLADFDLVFILLRIGSNRADRIGPYIPQIETILDQAVPGSFHQIEAEI